MFGLIAAAAALTGCGGGGGGSAGGGNASNNTPPAADRPLGNLTVDGNAEIVPINLPAAHFRDAEGDSLTFTATLLDGSPLSAVGLSLDDDDRIVGEFMGDAPVTVLVTAHDGELTATQTFTITPDATPGGGGRPVVDSGSLEVDRAVTVGAPIAPIDVTAGFEHPGGESGDLGFSVEFTREDSGLTFDAEENRIVGTFTGRDDVTAVVTVSSGPGAGAPSVEHRILISASSNRNPIRSATPLPDNVEAVAGRDIDGIDLSSAFIDPEGRTLTFEAAQLNGMPLPGAGLRLENNSIMGAPTSEGILVIMLTVHDPDGGQLTQVFTIAVAPPRGPMVSDAAPTSERLTPGVAPNPPIDAGAAFHDPDGSALRYEARVGADFDAGDPLSTIGLAIDPATGAVRAADPGVGFTGDGSVTITVRATDGEGLSADHGIGVMLNSAPAPATGTPLVGVSGRVGSSLSDGGIGLRSAFTDDLDIRHLTFSARISETGGLFRELEEIGLNIDDGETIAGTPTEAGAFTIEVAAMDGDGAVGTLEFVLTVVQAGEPLAPGSSNTPLTAARLTRGTTANLPIDARAAFSNPDGVVGDLRFGAVVGDDFGSGAPLSTIGLAIDPVSGTIASADQESGFTGGSTVITVRATNGDGLHFDQTLMIELNAAPYSLGIGIPPVSGMVGGRLGADIDVSGAFTDDLGPGQLSFSAGLKGSSGRTDGPLSSIGLRFIDGTTITGTPTVVGAFTIEVSAMDGDGAVGTRDFVLTVTPNPSAPTASGTPLGEVRLTTGSSANLPIDARAGFSDPDGDVDDLRFDARVGSEFATGGDLSTIGLAINPATGEIGAENMATGFTGGATAIVVRAIDGEGLRFDQTLRIELNTAPVSSGNHLGPVSGMFLVPLADDINVSGAFTDDRDSGRLTFSAAVKGSPGRADRPLDSIGLEFNNGTTISGTPGEAGTFTIVVTATDGDGAVGTREFVLTVAPNPDAPTVSESPLGTVRLTSGSSANLPIDARAGFSDPDAHDDELRFEARVGDDFESGADLATIGLAINASTGSIRALHQSVGFRGGAETIVVRATDWDGLRFDQTLMIELNGAPVSSGTILPPVSAMFAVALSGIDVSGAFTDDRDAGSLTYSAAVKGGPVTDDRPLASIGLDLNDGTTIAGTPAEAGTFTIVVHASDGEGGSGTREFVLTVEPNPGAPVASSTPLDTVRLTLRSNANLPFDAGSGFSDPDGEDGDLTFEARVGDDFETGRELSAFDLAIDRNTGMIRAANANAGFGGEADMIVVRATDGDGLHFDQTLTIARNSAPVASRTDLPPMSGMSGAALGSGIDVSGAFTDDLGVEQLTFSAGVKGIPGWPDRPLSSIGLEFAGGTTITGTPTEAGVFTIEVAAMDGDGAVGTREFVLTVAPDPGAPTASVTPLDKVRVTPGSAGSRQIDARAGFDDPDGNDDLLRFEARVGTDFATGADLSTIGLTIDNSTGAIDTANTRANLAGGATIVVRATDDEGRGLHYDQALVIEWNAAPSASESAIPNASGVVGVGLGDGIDVSGAFVDDPGTGQLTFSAVVKGVEGMANRPLPSIGLDIIGGTTIAGTPNEAGVFTIEVAAMDGDGAAGTREFVLSVSNGPALNGADLPSPRILQRLAPVGDIDVARAFTDVVGGGLTFDATVGDHGLPLATFGLGINSETGVISGTADVAGEWDIHVNARDMNGGVATGTFTIFVNNAPVDARRLASRVESLIGEEIEAINLLSAFWDREYDGLTFVVDGLAGTGLTHDRDSGMITGTLTATTEFEVTVTVTDARGGHTEKRFTVAPVAETGPSANKAPVWETALPARVAFPGEEVDIPVGHAFADPDGGVLTFSAMAVLNGDRRPLSEIGLTIDGATGIIRGDSYSGMVGTEIEVRASDGTAMVTGTFALEFASGPNTAPRPVPWSRYSQPDKITPGRENFIETEHRFEDPDGDALTYSAVLDGGAGLDTVGLEIDPEFGLIGGRYTGRDELTIEVTASDGRGGSATIDLRLGVNAPPVGVQVDEIALWTGTTLRVESGYFTDPDGDDLTYSVSLVDGDGNYMDGIGTVGLWRNYSGSNGGRIWGEFQSDRSARIRVAAEDEHGASAFQIIEVRLKDPLQATATPGAPFTFELPDDVLGAGNWADFTGVLNTGESLESVGLSVDGVNGTIAGVFTGTNAVEIDVRAENVRGRDAEAAGVTIRVELAPNAAGNADPVAGRLIGRVVAEGVDLEIDTSGSFMGADPGETFVFGATVGEADAALSTVGLLIDRGTGVISGAFEGVEGTAEINVTAFDGRGGFVTRSFDIIQNRIIPDQIAGADGTWSLTIPADVFQAHLNGAEPEFTAVFLAPDGSAAPVGWRASPEIPFSLDNGVLTLDGDASHSGHDLTLRVTGSAGERSVSAEFDVRVPHMTGARTAPPHWMSHAGEYGIGFDGDDPENPINGVHSLLDSDADHLYDRSPVNFLNVFRESNWQGYGSYDRPARLTYSFTDQGAEVGDLSEGEAFRATSEFNESQKEFIRSVFSHVEDFADVEFTEVADTSRTGSDIRVTLGSQRQFDSRDFVLGFAYYPYTVYSRDNVDLSHGGDVHIVSDYLSDDAFQTDYGREKRTISHELLHALGINHPFRGTGAVTSGQFGYHETGDFRDTDIVQPNHHGGSAGGGHDTPLADSVFETIMTYNNPITRGSFDYDGDIRFYADYTQPWQPGIFDIAALQHLYGANTETGSGDSTYAFESDTRVFQTIWDGGGVDVITHSGGRDAVIDLNPGGRSKVGLFGGDTYLLSASRIAGDGATFASFEVNENLGGGVAEIIPGFPLSNFYPNTVASFIPDLGSDIGVYGIDFTINVSDGSQISRSLTLPRDYFAKPEATHNVTIAHGVVIENAVGGDGDDLIIGNTADNVLTGGAGGDTFRFGWAAGTDRITDFTVGEDEIEFSGGVTKDDILSAQVVGGDFVFTAEGMHLTLAGVMTTLDPGTHYIFA